ncbi:D-glycero-alpha-D-manno-heptose-1,7-bisphosphate 7-phosphatase, partial [Streptomyces sp. NPDC018321]|uniref:D-glycero-alpha-D-manno-heptose-1,7-bisphosphate 7-phosphatase n=1 Tax=unclassified Streptomyces TaxID=2593676 RepID=UPI0037AEBC56
MSPVKAVLFDRDGTLVHDVPYNGVPDRVRPVDGAREAVALLREHGIRVGVVTNQSGVARGLITDSDVRHVNRRIDELVGPFDVWAVCPHGPDDGCHCRKPQPGMILWAAGRVCAGPADCVVIGDIGADMEAAERAGAHGILVPNDQTRPEETRTAAHVAPDLLTAVRAVLADPTTGHVPTDERPAETAYDAGGDVARPGRAPGDRAVSREGAAVTDGLDGAPGADGPDRGGRRSHGGGLASGVDGDPVVPDAGGDAARPGRAPGDRAVSREAAAVTDGLDGVRGADRPDRDGRRPGGRSHGGGLASGVDGDPVVPDAGGDAARPGRAPG